MTSDWTIPIWTIELTDSESNNSSKGEFTEKDQDKGLNLFPDCIL